ncbi:MAG TPA: aldose epimerase family protein [Anaerovoracaceae bacterium]|nr:aldose epimerase family protein [Anaerovoracaceae bacterium]
MSIKVQEYGILSNGEIVSRIVIKNSKGMEARIITYGAAISHLFVRDKNKLLVDVVLGYDRLEDYERENNAFGAVVGRHANRIKNAALIIDGAEYALTANNGKNSLHSGPSSLIRKNFSYRIIDENTVNLFALSPDGEEGFPGNLKLEVTYTLNDEDRFIINYHAETDKPTVINITNHSYFNLNGHDSGCAMGHFLMINSDTITENDETSVPTGRYLSVADTPFDFTSEKIIGERIGEDHDQLVYGNGYDHNYMLKKQMRTAAPEFAARLTGDKTGIIMNTFTTQPGLQLYAANHLKEGSPGKNNAQYGRRHGICLETQHFPGTPSNPHFPSVILRPGEEFSQTTIYEFVE